MRQPTQAAYSPAADPRDGPTAATGAIGAIALVVVAALVASYPPVAAATAGLLAATVARRGLDAVERPAARWVAPRLQGARPRCVAPRFE